VLVHHLALPREWQRALTEGQYTMSTRGTTLEDEGFIHCSRPDQVAAVHDRYYADLDDVLLLTIDTDLLTSPWQVDEVAGGDSYPHVYGPVDVPAVVSVEPFRRSAWS